MTFEWTRLVGSSDHEDGGALTTGTDGSIYIAGETYRDLDGQTNNGYIDVFISKFNPDGTKVWTRLLGSPNQDEINDLSTGADGSIYITGFTNGDLDGETNNGNYDAFISKFNPELVEEKSYNNY